MKPAEIKPLAPGRGSCCASESITVDNLPILFMYREEPLTDKDSGWVFMSGLETDEQLASPDSLGVFDVNTLANYDPTIVPYLDCPIGSSFSRASEFEPFEEDDFDDDDDVFEDED